MRADETDFSYCRGEDVDLRGARLRNSVFRHVYLDRCLLQQANLSFADFYRARLPGAKLRKSNLTGSRLIETDLSRADLTGARVHGVSTWNVKLIEAVQESLVVALEEEPELTVDSLEVAQFLYLLTRNEALRQVIDTLTAKAVLILGNFSPERLKVLRALQAKLRDLGYLPILFDFDKPASRDVTSTIVTLAGLSRFIIADVTSPRASPYELASIVPTTPVPVQRIIHSEQTEVTMLDDLRWRYDWVLPTHVYASADELMSSLATAVIGPAEAKLREVRARMQARTSLA